MSFAIDLVRHGETSSPGLLLGRSDAPVTKQGLTDMETQAARRHWRWIVTSPLGRARLSAAHAAQVSGAHLDVDEDWCEMDFGQWDGRPLVDIGGPEFDEFLERPETHGPPGGETWPVFTQRIARALDRLTARESRGAGDVAVITHAGAIRGALAVTTGLRFNDLWRLRIGCGTRITLHYGRGPSGALWGEITEIVQP